MKVMVAKKLASLAVLTTAAVLVNNMVLPKVHAREVDLETLCQKFPLNSRCAGYQSPSQRQGAAASEAPQVIKVRLRTPSTSNEWVRIEVSGNTLKLVHTTRANRRAVTGLLNGVLGAVSPLPLPRINSYRWYEHPTTRVVFEPNSCSEHLAPKTIQPSASLGCSITGTNSLTLAEKTDLRQGRFTIDYSDGDLLRSLTFRIPPEKK